MSRWSPRKAPTARQRRDAARTLAIKECQSGKHSMKATLVIGERICIDCGLMLVCSVCNPSYFVEHPYRQRAHEMRCKAHQRVEVQL